VDLFFAYLPALAQVAVVPVVPALITLIALQLLALLAKLIVLGFAYVKTKSPAAIAYGICLSLQAAVPFLVRLVNPEVFSRYAILLSFLEIILFIWLVYSLAKRFRPQQSLAADDV